MRKIILLSLSLVLLWYGSGVANAGSKVKNIKKRGLKCGVSEGLPGFSSTNKKGIRQGFDVDFCRAVAAAIGVKVQIVPLTAKNRFTALQSGEVDLLFRNTTFTMSRDTKMGLDFLGVNYYDGQGFIVRRKSGVKSAKDLNGATICVQAGTTTELNLSDYFRTNRLKYKSVVLERADDVAAAFEAGRCDAYTSDASGLAGHRSGFKNPKAYVILPEIISKEPLGPAVAQGDQQLSDIVRWVLNATIIAEEKGITRRNVSKIARSSKDPEVQRMLGKTGSFGPDAGLPQDWAVKAIAKSGNYGEIFERNLGSKTSLRLERGLNQLASKGGLLYAPPIR